MKPYFDVVPSEDGDGSNDVVFAFDADLDEGSISHVHFVSESVQDALEDTGESTEDYVINTLLPEEKVVEIMTRMGYERNEDIRELMWG